MLVFCLSYGRIIPSFYDTEVAFIFSFAGCRFRNDDQLDVRGALGLRRELGNPVGIEAANQ